MSNSSPHEISHGNTTAAWTGVAILLVATALICLGLVFAMPLLWIPGIVGVPLGAFAWAMMNRVGYGEKRH